MSFENQPPLDEATLIHFGVKGMKWGQRNEDKLSGGSRSKGKEETPARLRSSSPYALTEREKAILDGAGLKTSDAKAMKDKYGPDSLSKTPEKKGRLTEEQKDLLKGLVITAGVAAGAWYLYHKANKVVQDEYFKDINPVERLSTKSRNMEGFRKEWHQYVATASSRERGWTVDTVNKLSDEPVQMKAGAIFRRLSTQQETSIRPGGFYAAHSDEDVNRYKAILPIYWKMWGKSANSGHLVHIKANADVKAPSPKKTYEMFRGLMNDEVGTPNLHTGKRLRLRDFYPGGKDAGDDDSIARRIFPHFAGSWANENHPGTKHFFSRLKGDGYNAVVDMNDAGALAKQPMRLLDGNMFSISHSTPVKANDILDAQERIQAIVHAMLALGRYDISTEVVEEAYLAHFGVKGMKWGQRKPEESGGGQPRSGLHITNQQAVTAAFAVGAVAVSAVLLKRGGISVWNSNSTKTASFGARMAGSVLTKTGGVLVRTSAKVGKVGGKIALKGGKMGGKVGLKVGKAAGTGIGTGIAKSGQKAYESLIKKPGIATAKIGSHLMFKFTGKGTPIVKEVTKSRLSLQPLNTLLAMRRK